MIRRILFERWRRDAQAIFQAGVRSVDPETLVRRAIRPRRDGFQIDDRHITVSGSVWVVGAGKASARMARAVEAVLGDRIAGGVVVTKDGYDVPTNRVTVHTASHPVPDTRSVTAARAIVDVVRRADPGDHILVLLSGGASALMEWPLEHVSLEDMQTVTRMLLECGATIHEINTVRKHLSRVKGGQLIRWAHPTPVTTLAISDVVGNDPSVIGSGPTVPDPSRFADARAVLERYGLWDRIPPAIRDVLEKGMCHEIPETPKPGDPIFRHATFVCIGDNQDALTAAARKARRRGYHTVILTSFLEGDVQAVAQWIVAVARQVMTYGQPVRPPACILWGGETTVQVRGPGQGGRNQELVVRVGTGLQPDDPVVFLSGGTDGTDGPTDAAGGVIDGATVARGRQQGIHPEPYLERSDTYTYLQRVGGLLLTGPTGTNVMDLLVLIVGAGVS